MAPSIDAALRGDQPSATPNFLSSTPDGFEDRQEDTIHTELVGQLIEARPIVKLFEDNRVSHTSDDCNNDPDCPMCARRSARHYVRLLLGVDGRVLQLDLPPKARRSFVAYAEAVGYEENPMIRLVSTRKESATGFAWPQITVSTIEKGAA
jgi:hypothetical protein